MVENHIKVKSDRDPPEGVLRQLRVIDPSLDLHYLGAGRWAVGAVRPNVVRRAIAIKMLHNMQYVPDDPRFKQRHRLATLVADGFGVIAAYKFVGEPTSQIVEDVRQRDYTYMHRAEQELARRMEEADTRDKRDDSAMLAEVEYREKNVTPQLFRGAKSVSGKGDDFGPNGPKGD